MSSFDSKDHTKTKLEGVGDWLAWSSLFESRARAAYIWDVISPPSMKARTAQKTATTSHKAEDEDQDTVFEQTSPSTMQAATTAPATPDPAPQTFLEKPKRPPVPSNEGPSASEKYLLQLYDIDLRAFQAETLAIREIKTWVLETVSPALRQTNCLPHENLKVWYDNLKESIVADSQLIARGQANLAYQEFMSTKVRSVRQLCAWVDAFELMMIRSQAMKVPNAQDPISWFTSLKQAAHPLLRPKMDILKTLYKEKLEKGTLTFREVANALRFEIKTTEGLEPHAKGKRLAGFIAGGEEPTFDEDRAEEPPKKKKTNRKKKVVTPEDGATAPAKESAPALAAPGGSASSRRACPVCESTTHTFTGCWYAFPKKAPATFVENPTQRALADENLKDERLAGEVARWEKQFSAREARD